MEAEQLKRILEAALLAASQPLTPTQLAGLFGDEESISHEDISRALEQLALDCETRGIELKEVASGFRFQIREDVHAWVARLWTERPTKYSRALLETLALIAYRQPITRAEIEQIRGVAVSTGMVKTLEEREWIRVVGYRDVPGKPALFGTSRNFLDYFNLRSLDELPALADIRDLEEFEPQLDLAPVSMRPTLELPPDDDEPMAAAPLDAQSGHEEGSDTDEVIDDITDAELVGVVDDDDFATDSVDPDDYYPEDTDEPTTNTTHEQQENVDESTNDTAAELHDSDAASAAEPNEPTTSDDVPEHTA